MFSRLRNKLIPALIAATILTVSGAVVLQPAYVAAAPVDVLQACNSQSEVCKGRKDEKNSLFTLIQNIINLLLMIIGIVAVIMIVIGGIRYTTSAGDPGQAKSARDTIVYALVGVVIAIMSYALVNWVLDRL